MAVTAEEWLVKMGVKGANVVLSQYKKIEDAKKKFATSKTGQIGAKGFDAFQRTLGTGGGLASILGKGAKALTQPREKSDAEQLADAKRKEAFESNRVVRAARATGEALKTLGQGAATLDPTAFLTGVASAAGAAFESIPFAGGVAKGLKEATIMGLQAATGAVAASKASMSSVIDTNTKRGRNQFYGENVSFGTSSGGSSRLSLAEKSSLIEGVSGRFGKIGKEFGATLTKALSGDKRYDPQMLGQVASGNFSAIGTDKAWMQQQLANSFGNLPPTLAQKFQNALFKQALPDIAEDKAQAARGSAAYFDDQERSQQQKVYEVYGENYKQIVGLNNELNKLQIQLISAGAQLTGVVKSFAGAAVTVIDKAGGGRRGKATGGS
jgi:hypothetical protein